MRYSSMEYRSMARDLPTRFGYSAFRKGVGGFQDVGGKRGPSQRPFALQQAL